METVVREGLENLRHQVRSMADNILSGEDISATRFLAHAQVVMDGLDTLIGSAPVDTRREIEEEAQKVLDLHDAFDGSVRKLRREINAVDAQIAKVVTLVQAYAVRTPERGESERLYNVAHEMGSLHDEHGLAMERMTEMERHVGRTNVLKKKRWGELVRQVFEPGEQE